jgi:hypothetical protein
MENKAVDNNFQTMEACAHLVYSLKLHSIPLLWMCVPSINAA